MSKVKKYLALDKKQIRHYKRKTSEREDTAVEIREEKDWKDNSLQIDLTIQCNFYQKITCFLDNWQASLIIYMEILRAAKTILKQKNKVGCRRHIDI